MTPGIFKREDEQPSEETRAERGGTRSGEGGSPASGGRRSGAGPGAGSASVIGPGTTVVGAITLNEDLQIDGRLDGSVSTDGRVTVASRGTVEGDIEAAEVVVAGRVDGTVYAREVARFRSGCRVNADVHTPSLMVEEGGVLDGRLVMTEKARAESAPVRAPAGGETKKGSGGAEKKESGGGPGATSGSASAKEASGGTGGSSAGPSGSSAGPTGSSKGTAGSGGTGKSSEGTSGGTGSGKEEKAAS